MNKLFLILTLGLLSLVYLPGCGVPPSGISGEVIMMNNSGDQYHMFLAFEGFDISNRLDPGRSRTARFNGFQTIANEITVVVGRNGVQEATTTCVAVQKPSVNEMNDIDLDGLDDNAFRSNTVTWDGVTLTCALDNLDNAKIRAN